MTTYRFTVERHEDFDILGLCPKWYPSGDPLLGIAAAHDILEHFPGDNGSVEGELMALGAAMRIRGDGGYTSPVGYGYFDEIGGIASEFHNLWPYVLRRGSRSIRACGRSHDMSRSYEIVDEIKRQMRDYPDHGQPTDQDYEHIARWLSKGYMKACRRYRNTIGGTCAVASLFMDIERACDQELRDVQEGMIVLVTVNAKRCRMSIKSTYPDEW